MIPAALTYTSVAWSATRGRDGPCFAAMGILFVALLALANVSEQQGNPLIAKLGVDQAASDVQPGGNMEGKEARFGIGGIRACSRTISTATSTGAVNAMHDSFTPLGGFVPLFQMQLGEVVFGGVGSGLYSMLIFAIVGVFIAGLMIGRTPEYIGKKIEAFEMKMSSVAILVMPFIVLVGTAVAVSVPVAQAGVANPGAHGFSEILYAFTSAGNNNGSCVLRPLRQHAVLQHGAGARDVVRPLLADRRGARDRRFARGEEARARDVRNDAHVWTDVRDPADRHGAARRRAHVRAGARTGSGRRTPLTLGRLKWLSRIQSSRCSIRRWRGRRRSMRSASSTRACSGATR